MCVPIYVGEHKLEWDDGFDENFVFVSGTAFGLYLNGGRMYSSQSNQYFVSKHRYSISMHSRQCHEFKAVKMKWKRLEMHD